MVVAMAGIADAAQTDGRSLIPEIPRPSFWWDGEPMDGPQETETRVTSLASDTEDHDAQQAS